MPKVSTLLYVIDNVEKDKEELIDLEKSFGNNPAELKIIHHLLDFILFEVDKRLVSQILEKGLKP